MYVEAVEVADESNRDQNSHHRRRRGRRPGSDCAMRGEVVLCTGDCSVSREVDPRKSSYVEILVLRECDVLCRCGASASGAPRTAHAAQSTAARCLRALAQRGRTRPVRPVAPRSTGLARRPPPAPASGDRPSELNN